MYIYFKQRWNKFQGDGWNQVRGKLGSMQYLAKHPTTSQPLNIPSSVEQASYKGKNNVQSIWK
jgi:hypothetical protein